MIKRAIQTVILLTLFFMATAFASTGKLIDTRSYVAGELLVKFKDKRSFNANKSGFLDINGAIRQKISRYKVKQRFFHPQINVEHWKLEHKESLFDTIKKLKKDPDVVNVEPNYRRFPRTTHENSPLTLSNRQLAQTKLDKLREIPPTNSVLVAILDDAFEITHEDLIDKVFLPRDAVNNTDDPSPETCFDTQELEDHGTKVMGVLAAGVNNGIGVNGATDSSTKIIPVRLSCNYTVAAELKAIQWVMANNVNIINMSYGGPQFSIFETEAIQMLANKNILVVTAAGNNEVDNDRIPDYPSGLDLPNILAVAAANKDKQLTKWSQYGQTSVDLAAPGGIFQIGTTFVSNEYGLTTGTSFSAPIVAGVAASLMARNSDITAYDIKGAILASVEPYTSLHQAKLAAGGFVDAYAANLLLGEASAKPVPLIKRIKIDDSAGNNNGEVDFGETIELVITLENIWGDADTLKATLSSVLDNMTPIKKTLSGGLKGFNNEDNTYSSVELRFAVDFGIRTQSQGLLFTLDIEGKYNASTLDYRYQRAFTIDTGSLLPNSVIQNSLRKHDQDDVHYYSIYLVEPKEELTIKLEILSNEPLNNLNLLANRRRFPEFNFLNYKDETFSSVSEETVVSANKDSQPEIISFTDLKAGETIFLAVVASDNTVAMNVVYKITSAATDFIRATPVNSGCTIGKVRNTSQIMSIDPTLPLLLLFSLSALVKRKKEK